MLDRLDAEHAVEARVVERQMLHVRLNELDLEPVALRPPAGGLQDARRDVRPDEAARAIGEPRDAGEEAAVAAACIEERIGRGRFGGERDHPFELTADGRIGEVDRVGVLDLRAALVYLAERVGRTFHGAETTRAQPVLRSPAAMPAMERRSGGTAASSPAR